MGMSGQLQDSAALTPVTSPLNRRIEQPVWALWGREPQPRSCYREPTELRQFVYTPTAPVCYESLLIVASIKFQVYSISSIALTFKNNVKELAFFSYFFNIERALR
jgi:hypothetical protein